MEIPLTYSLKFSEAKLFRNERDELISKFLNRGIKVFKNKKLVIATARDIAIITAHVPIEALHALYKNCDKARTFSKLFHYLVKTNEV